MSTRLFIVAAVAAVIVVVAWAIATSAAGPSSRPTKHIAPTQASALGGLTRPGAEYAVGILSLTPAQFRAAFGTDQPSGDTSWMRSLHSKRTPLGTVDLVDESSELAAAFDRK